MGHHRAPSRLPPRICRRRCTSFHLVAEPGWELSIWGPTTLTSDGLPVVIRPKERALLAALASAAPAPVEADRLASLMWGEDPPATARNSIQNHVARIRAVADGVVVTEIGGYALSPLVRISASEALEHGDDPVTLPYADLAETVEVEAMRHAAQGLRREHAAGRLSQRLEQGLFAESLIEIERIAVQDPDDERWPRLHARALAGAGRRREALDVIREATRRAAHAGYAPDRSLRDLERRIFDDDPTLFGAGGGRPAAMDPALSARSVGTGHVVGVDADVQRIERGRNAAAVSLVAVTGPAGFGKTTLVEHVRDRADQRGEPTLLAACAPEPSIPFEPFTDILHQIADRFPAAIDEHPDLDVLRSLAPSLGAGNAAQQLLGRPDRSALFAAVTTAFQRIGRPVMIVFEDLHWATPLTLQMLSACMSTTDVSSSLTILATSREANVELVSLASEHLELEAWPEARVREYVERFGRPSSWCADAAEWIHRQSNGTALFVRELTVAAHAGAVDAPFEPPSETPATLGSALRSTLQGLSASTRRDLGSAAVLGRRCRFSEWVDMCFDAAASLEEAVLAGVLEQSSGDDVQFRHELLHRIVLDDLSHGRRIELHDLAHRSIEASGSAGTRSDELARHAVAAASIDAARAVESLLRAIVVDTAGFAYETGVERCRMGLQLIGDDVIDRDRVVFETHLGQLLLRIGDTEALDWLLDAVRHALELGDDDLVAEAIREACRLGPTSIVGSVHDEAGQLLDRAIESVTDERAAAIVATAGVMLYAISGEYERCRAYFERAACFEGDVLVRVDALGLAVLILTEHDDFDRRVDIERELTRVAATIGSSEARWSAAHLRMTNQIQSGDPRMRATLGELSELTSSLRQRTRLWEFTNWSASVALTDGDPDRAEQLATEALGCIDAVAESLVMSAYGVQLLSIRHAQGRVAELLDMVAPIVDAGDAIGAWRAVLALAAAEAGQPDLARRHLELVVADGFAALDRDYTFNGALFATALAAVRIGADDIARSVEPELATWSGRWAFVGTCAMGPVDTALAEVAELLGNEAHAVDLATRALESARHADAPIYIGQAETVLARLVDPNG